MADHECVIGLLHRYDGSECVSLNQLKKYIQAEIIEFNEECRKYGFKSLMRKNWSLRDYSDKRKSTNLTRFDFCPQCGKRIDWAAIRKEDTDG